MSLGDKMKKLRKRDNITQEELAEKIFVSRQTISNWENNKSYPSIDFINSISKFFNVTIDYLISEDVNYKLEEKQSELKAENLTTDKKTIRKNKDRDILNRLTFFRFSFVWIGSLLVAYFYASNRHLDFILAPIFLLICGFLNTIPINRIKNKYQLKTQEDLAKFYDELYK